LYQLVFEYDKSHQSKQVCSERGRISAKSLGKRQDNLRAIIK